VKQHVLSVGSPTSSIGRDFESFFQAEYRRLCQALVLLTGDSFEAEEVAQEAMTRVLERWDRVSGMESPSGYVFRTALNLHRNRLRRIAVRARRVFTERPAEDHGSLVADQEDVRTALADLPIGFREALVLVDWLELNTDEAGEVLGLSANAVRVRLHRARSAMRDRLGDGR
jgi:RNA polymerase sigma-70 factor, ECF subfamily